MNVEFSLKNVDQIPWKLYMLFVAEIPNCSSNQKLAYIYTS